MENQPGIETALEVQPTQPPGQQQEISSKRMQQQRADIAAVKEIMQQNIERVCATGKIADLHCTGEVPAEEGAEFDKHAKTLHRKFWWKNCKMLAILIGIGLVIIVVILVWAVSKMP